MNAGADVSGTKTSRFPTGVHLALKDVTEETMFPLYCPMVTPSKLLAVSCVTVRLDPQAVRNMNTATNTNVLYGSVSTIEVNERKLGAAFNASHCPGESTKLVLIITRDDLPWRIASQFANFCNVGLCVVSIRSGCPSLYDGLRRVDFVLTNVSADVDEGCTDAICQRVELFKRPVSVFR